MKNIKYSIFGLLLIFCQYSCKKIIDLNPISNIGADAYYTNAKDIEIALTGCYNGLQEPLKNEWMLTEVRSDNAKQGVPTSSSTTNLDINQFDMYQAESTIPELYDYWISVYKNIRSINYVLRSLGVSYSNGEIAMQEGKAKLTEAEKNRAAGEALFLRAYHYFNLVRLYGGVFLLAEPTNPQAAQQMQRSSVSDIYQFIEADLKTAIGLLPSVKYANTQSADKGRANLWAAKALLAKVYLTIGKAGDVLSLLNDVIDNSGYGLETSFADVFSPANEMNKEVLFAVRFKAGGVGLGNFMPNLFAAQGSGSAIVNGDGKGYNYPTDNLDSSFNTKDPRHDFSIGKYIKKLYSKKFVVPVATIDDGENDFPILRFADVLLMKAEATGFDGAGGSAVSLINQIRERAGAANYVSGDFDAAFYKYPTDAGNPYAITDANSFLEALLDEGRWEFAFENQRLFTLIRTGQAESVIKGYFAYEYDAHYSKYSPQPSLSSLQANVTADHLILPIPQREVDANTTIKIQQNPGY